ncbi:conserved hypothetical protein [[Clostridium] ultunense Esp]|uniref:DUF370 domain-containing protein n=1 Tax=[Clostridium] ultunense Esp TaxID=1288971 RepID=M1Z238_9FIRM|nr:hypothetical protein [Schnuerera ultunensis]CCQ96925.1 conserved hypothetical protein [[Clostridium] ultunense Esp]SHD78035.1 conserved protein of unknown function [[Clostridium] ultunense Esp]
MFLHIGNNINIFLKDIVAIIDKNSLENSKDNNGYIKNLLKNDFLANENMDDIKTYIITCSSDNPRRKRKSGKKHFVYTSNISSATLMKRNKSIETRLEVSINGQ